MYNSRIIKIFYNLEQSLFNFNLKKKKKKKELWFTLKYAPDETW